MLRVTFQEGKDCLFPSNDSAIKNRNEAQNNGLTYNY